MNHNSEDYLHLLVEAFKLSLADTTHFNADPAQVKIPLEGLLAKDYSHQRARLIQMDRCCRPVLSRHAVNIRGFHYMQGGAGGILEYKTIRDQTGNY